MYVSMIEKLSVDVKVPSSVMKLARINLVSGKIKRTAIIITDKLEISPQKSKYRLFKI